VEGAVSLREIFIVSLLSYSQELLNLFEVRAAPIGEIFADLHRLKLASRAAGKP